MTSKLEGLLDCIICDTGAFIKCDRLDKIGKEVYTIREVIEEIRDKVTRDKLSVLPFELKFREPSTDSILAINKFAKKVGDFSSLSAVDIRVMALTYQLCIEHGGKDILITEPTKATVTPTYRNVNSKVKLAGFYNDTKEATALNVPASDNSELELELEVNFNEHQSGKDNATDVELVSKEEDNLWMNDRNSSDNEPTVESGDEGWITPRNIKRLNEKSNNKETYSPELAVKVACVTTDFAMQNVLMQMGLPIVSVDGYVIHHLKNYALRCHSCLRISNDTSKQFCPSCGHKTLLKVTLSVDEKGNKQYILTKNKGINTRGMKYPLPLPKGGRFSNNPLLSEDQCTNRLLKPLCQRTRLNVFDRDYVARSSPFLTNDVHSRAAKLQFQGAGHHKSRRTNPNEVSKKGKRRK